MKPTRDGLAVATIVATAISASAVLFRARSAYHLVSLATQHEVIFGRIICFAVVATTAAFSLVLGARISLPWLYVAAGVAMLLVVYGEFATGSLVPTGMVILVAVAAVSVIRRGLFTNVTKLVIVVTIAFIALTVGVTVCAEFFAPMAFAGASLCLFGTSAMLRTKRIGARMLASVGWLTAMLSLCFIVWAAAFLE